MSRKSQPGAKLIRPDDPGHRVTFDDFSLLVVQAGLEKIEKTIGIASPCEGFRHSLIQFLWRFFRHSLPEADVIFNRNVLKKELRTAAGLAERLEISAALIWSSRDTAILEWLAPFGAMFQGWQSPHPSGVAWIGLLREFAFTTKLLADTLDDDAGGPRRASAFGDLMIGLAGYHRLLTHDRNSALPEEDFFRFVASIVDALRKIKERLPAADFKLPPTDRALRQRLRQLTARVGRQERQVT